VDAGALMRRVTAMRLSGTGLLPSAGRPRAYAAEGPARPDRYAGSTNR
jgi:hypothetical protein